MVRRFAVSLAAVLAFALPAAAADLAVDVNGLRSDKGKVYVAIHSAVDGVEFPASAGMIAGASKLAQPGGLQVVFRGLPPARYAVNAFHDENGNGELDTNILGIPSEGYGFANDAKGTMGPPSFSDASVSLREAGAAVAFTIGY